MLDGDLITNINGEGVLKGPSNELVWTYKVSYGLVVC